MEIQAILTRAALIIIGAYYHKFSNLNPYAGATKNLEPVMLINDCEPHAVHVIKIQSPVQHVMNRDDLILQTICDRRMNQIETVMESGLSETDIEVPRLR